MGNEINKLKTFFDKFTRSMAGRADRPFSDVVFPDNMKIASFKN